MALLMNDAHIIYYHMDALWSVGLEWSYFSHPDYFVVPMLGLCYCFVSIFYNLSRVASLPLGWWVTYMRVHLVIVLGPS